MKKMKCFLALMLAVALGVTGCSGKTDSKKKDDVEVQDDDSLHIIDDNYRNFYEVFLFSFCDSNGDGIGDIQGLISKLDYINDGDDTTDTDLGCNGIWLMPFHLSPTYHKYDVEDYFSVDPVYGTIDDMKQLIEECDKRGIKLIMDFVMNHTYTGHEWFDTAAKYLSELPEGKEPDSSECKYVDYYHFAKGKPTTGVYQRVVGTVDWYYECKFSGNMPDLDLFNEDVRREYEEIAKYWLDMGIDGFRLDAAKEYESDNNEKNVEILTWFASYVKNYKPDTYIVAEVFDGIGTYAQYLKSGIDSVFEFDLSKNNGYVAQTINGMLSDTCATNFGKKIEATIKTEKSFNPNYIMAPFIGNHDIDRIAPGYAYNPDKIKIALGMLEMLNGSTFLYYGDELGMGGTGRDENKRAPVIWSSTDTSKNCNGPAAMEANMVEYKFPSVEEQVKDPESIFNFTRKTIRLRNKYPEIARGEMTVLDTDNTNVLTMKKVYNDSQIIIVINTKNTEQKVTISKSDNGFSSLRETVAAASTQTASLEDDTLTMPAFSIAILK